MPETALTNDMIVGLWSPDPNAQKPRYIDFLAKGDLVTYDYYSLIDSRALGRLQPSGPVKLEFCNGVVDMMLNQGRCSCLTRDSSGTYISFYIDEMQTTSSTTRRRERRGTASSRTSSRTADKQGRT